jgi:hypothetical protein
MKDGFATSSWVDYGHWRVSETELYSSTYGWLGNQPHDCAPVREPDQIQQFNHDKKKSIDIVHILFNCWCLCLKEHLWNNTIQADPSHSQVLVPTAHAILSRHMMMCWLTVSASSMSNNYYSYLSQPWVLHDSQTLEIEPSYLYNCGNLNIHLLLRSSQPRSCVVT